MKHGGSGTWDLFFYTRKAALGRVVHKQAYGGYRSLQEPSDCFPFQSAHVLSADVLQVSNFTGGNFGFAKIPLWPNLS